MIRLEGKIREKKLRKFIWHPSTHLHLLHPSPAPFRIDPPPPAGWIWSILMSRQIKGEGFRFPPNSSDVVKFHGFVDQCFCCQPEILFFLVGVFVYFGPEDVLHKVLWVRYPDALRQSVRFDVS
ncbi:hypothetical protein K7X08_013626 [Anisodus acutangulus]|uniref:Uncharacterized protein n=1 Tax=Anisodus acutangulus TaxID=402998 RepID=A0A9Q1LP38_9SOLA|nr:hypothetical protein K7X08_013626 [Anisodus acutangulus]